jgi:hypothetical protein
VTDKHEQNGETVMTQNTSTDATLIHDMAKREELLVCKMILAFPHPAREAVVIRDHHDEIVGLAHQDTVVVGQRPTIVVSADLYR